MELEKAKQQAQFMAARTQRKTYVFLDQECGAICPKSGKWLKDLSYYQGQDRSIYKGCEVIETFLP